MAIEPGVERQAVQPDPQPHLYAEGAEGFRSEEMILNMGPQHPSTHGVLRLVLTLDGETVVHCTPVIGYLHRGIEKILENRPYMGGIRYMDNSDYLSPMINETAYAGAVEQLMGLEPPRRAQYIRLMTNEMQRIASHMVAIGTYLLDLGAMTPILYCFRDREGILSLFEALGGSRFNVNYLRVGGVLHDFPKGWLSQLEQWCKTFDTTMRELEDLIVGNEIFEARTQGVGYIDPQQAVAYGLTGPNLRGSGVPFDVRVDRPYMAYREVAVKPAVRQEGDAFARFRVRMDECYESLRLIRVAMDRLPGGPVSARVPVALRPPRGETYFAVESSKGEQGIYLMSDGSEYPWRAKVRGPSFVNLQILPELLRGHKMGDVVAILGSIDLVLGEVDR
jgi:NADH-quinone oxidoreductase subunit D